MNGFINLLKPCGMTSSDAVLAVRKLLPRKTPVGHGGTLDPDAAGVLPVCVGKATRLFDYIIDKKKTYIGELRTGIVTDTCDASGKVLSVCEVRPDACSVEKALPQFTGEILQIPPMYSALKRGGEPLYKLARRGENLELEARRVTVYELELLEQTAPDRFLIRIECGKGTYIRSLMRDLGDALGCGGHMAFLLRSAAGAFRSDDGVTLEELQQPGALEQALHTMDYPLEAYPAVRVSGDYRLNIMNGQAVLPDWTEEIESPPQTAVRLYAGKEFAGMGIVDEDGSVKVKTMLLEREV